MFRPYQDDTAKTYIRVPYTKNFKKFPQASAEPVDFGAIVSLKENVTEGIVR